MEKMIMIPEWRYNKMMESLDKALEELEVLREQLEVSGSERICMMEGDD